MASTTTLQQLPYPDPGDTVDVPRDVKALAEKLDPLGYAPIGSILMWPAAAAPAGWLLMQGQTNLPAATYPVLAGLLGQTGGMLKMPDMRDRFALGAGAEALAAIGGQRNTQLLAHIHNEANAGSHSHGGFSGFSDRSLAHQHSPAPGYFFVYSASNGISQQILPSGGVTGQAVPAHPVGSADISGGSTGDFTSGIDHRHAITADGDHSHVIASNGMAAPDNRPPFVAVNYMIRAG